MEILLDAVITTLVLKLKKIYCIMYSENVTVLISFFINGFYKQES